MFRIKTDIRQYKCESREKVERLIRNWVVRPTDLIFDDEKQEWGPIGEHSEFVSTFAELAKREEQAPDTVVSSEPPPIGASPGDGGEERDDEDSLSESSDGELEPPEPPEGIEPSSDESDEITVMTEETLEDILEEGEREEGGDIKVVETREGVGESEPPGDREATQPEAPRPRMGNRDRSDGPGATRVEGGDGSTDRETLDADSDIEELERERKSSPGLGGHDSDGESGGEPTRIERPSGKKEFGQGPPEGPGGLGETSDVERSESTRVETPNGPPEPSPHTRAPEESEPETVGLSSSSDVSNSDQVSTAGSGTNGAPPPPEASTDTRTTKGAGGEPDPDMTWPDPDADTLPPGSEEELAVEQDLRDTDEFDDDATEKGAELVDGSDSAGRPEMPPTDELSAALQSERSEEKLGRHNLPEEMFATDELAEAAEEAESGEFDSAPGDEGSPQEQGESVDYAEVEEALQENARTARQQHVDDEWDQILERLRETDELSKEEIDEITKTRDQIAIGRDEGEADAVSDATVPDEIEEYVSEGYDKELPIPIGPTSRDVQLGLRRSRASTDEKDRVFPYPTAKREGEVKERRFALRASYDHSATVIATVVGFVIGLILLGVFVL